MTSALDFLAVALLGLATTSSSLLGVAIGLYIRFPKRVLAAILAFAAGALISALAIELAISRDQANRLLVKTGHGTGLAIVLGNILDTIPGCLVIGAKFNGIESLENLYETHFSNRQGC